MEYRFYFATKVDESAKKHHNFYAEYKFHSELDKFSHIFHPVNLIGKPALNIIPILDHLLHNTPLKNIISLPGKYDLHHLKATIESLKDKAKTKNDLIFYSHDLGNPKLINMELQSVLEANAMTHRKISYPTVMITMSDKRMIFEIKTKDDALAVFHVLHKQKDPTAFVWLRYASVL